MIKKQKTVTHIMFIYWILVILWQTFRPVGNRSIVDIAVKIILFSFVCIYAWNHQNARRSGVVQSFLIVFILTQLFTIFLDVLSLSTVITFVFMVAQIVVFLVLLRNSTIDYKQLLQFGKWLIITALFMSVYNIVFRFNRFSLLFTGGGGYGAECRSFLYSNHEFAVYLSVAILFLINSLFETKKRRIYKFVTLIIFVLNLLSTYSRTAILGCFIAVAVLLLINNKYWFFVYLGAIAIIFLISNNNATVYDFIYNQLFKGENSTNNSIFVDQGRLEMYSGELSFFINANLVQKIFGRGYVGGVVGGGHNAYLYILNIGGIVMFVLFMFIIVWSIINALKCYRFNKKITSICLSMQLFSLLYMLVQTPILFFSTMDSYFITIIFVIIPLYCLNNFELQFFRQQKLKKFNEESNESFTS